MRSLIGLFQPSRDARAFTRRRAMLVEFPISPYWAHHYPFGFSVRSNSLIALAPPWAARSTNILSAPSLARRSGVRPATSYARRIPDLTLLGPPLHFVRVNTSSCLRSRAPADRSVHLANRPLPLVNISSDLQIYFALLSQKIELACRKGIHCGQLTCQFELTDP